MLERCMQEIFRVMPDQTVYFSRQGAISPKYSNKHFIKASFNKNLNLIKFKFKVKIDWQDIENLYNTEKHYLSVLFSCDDERFYDLSTEFHTLSPPVDENVTNYELKLIKKNERLEIISDGTYNLRFYINYKDLRTGKKVFKTLNVKSKEKKLLDNLRKVLQYKKENPFKVVEKENLISLLKMPKEELSRLKNIKWEEENVIMTYEELIDRVKKTRDLMLSLPEIIRKGKLKTSFKFTNDCKVKYYIDKLYENIVNLYYDNNIDWDTDFICVGSDNDIFGIRQVGFDISYHKGICHVKGRVGKELLGEGKLEEFLNNFNV